MTPYMYSRAVLWTRYLLPESYPGYGVVDPNCYAEVSPYLDGDFTVHSGVFHLFKNLHDAKQLRDDLQTETDRFGKRNEKYYVAKAVVPTGTLIIEGTFNVDSYSAPAVGVKCVKYTEIVE